MRIIIVNMEKNKKVLIAMSGGVDSSVAAALLKSEGYECAGVTMKLYENEVNDTAAAKTCCSADDVYDARSVAASLGIPYYVFNFKDDFSKQVIDRFVYAYENGMTPNPCIDCNRYMKFEKLHLKAKTLGYDYVATGHYARVEYDEKSGRYLLKKGLDTNKDQSYVLYSMTQEQLAHTRFPLGGYTKDKIRQIAYEYGFVNAKKRDSQDICFVPDGDYAGFIKRYTGKEYESGNFINRNGDILGNHKGIIYYTIGQRKGLGLSLKEPAYVCEKRLASNEVVLGKNEELFTDALIAKDFNWIAYESPEKEIKVTAKTRYSQTEKPAHAKVRGDGSVEVIFDEPVRAVTKGQAVVLYDGDLVVGGGRIVRAGL